MAIWDQLYQVVDSTVIAAVHLRMICRDPAPGSSSWDDSMPVVARNMTLPDEAKGIGTGAPPRSVYSMQSGCSQVEPTHSSYDITV
jgi:hypothetical protein